jgi:hypothetical protein
VRPEGLCQRKIPVTPSGIDDVTFQFVAQCLNHCATSSVTLGGAVHKVILKILFSSQIFF